MVIAASFGIGKVGFGLRAEFFGNACFLGFGGASLSLGRAARLSRAFRTAGGSAELDLHMRGLFWELDFFFWDCLRVDTGGFLKTFTSRLEYNVATVFPF